MSAIITEPGVYDLPFEDYLADPIPGGSLSTSGAKTLLGACPALFDYQRRNGRPDTRDFDFGHAAHSQVLGAGMSMVIVQKTAKDGTKSDADNYNTKSAQDHRDEIRASGLVPILRREMDTVEAMAAALREHPAAGRLLHPDRGTPEQSLFWTDENTGVWRRARLDALPHPAIGRMVIADYKTTASAKPALFAKSIANYGYHMQGAAYIDAIKALSLADDAAFLLVAQEKTPPYLISVIELSAPALRVGRERNLRAMEIFKRCTETNNWPAYVEGIELVDLPLWAEREHEMELAS